MNSNFLNELSKENFIGNAVLLIDGEYYSQHSVDSGLTVDHVGTVIDVSISASKVDFRDVKSSIPSMNFSLLDKDDVISDKIALSEEAWQNFEVKFYYGFITSGFGWANYELLSTTRVKTLDKSANTYKFTSAVTTDLIQVSIYSDFTQLDEDLDDSETSIDLVDATDFPSAGIIRVNDEYISYTGKATDTLTGCTRGALSSEATEHDTGDDVFEVTTLEDESMDILLDILLNEIGIDSALIDSSSFTDLRDDNFAGEGDFKFYVHNVENALEWIEDNILLATNTRLITSPAGKISIAILDQFASVDDIEEINEDHTIGNPGYKINVDRVKNKVIIRYDYTAGTGKFTSTYIDTDSDSITNFGEKPFEMEFPGVLTANGGAAIVANRASRILERLSTPRAEIDCTTHFNRFLIGIAENILFTNRFLPQPAVGGTFEQILEVQSKAPIKFANDAKVKFKLSFTSYNGLRYGFIAPAGLISLVSSQKIFSVPDGSLWEVGYVCKLFNSNTKVTLADATNIIESINGNQITMTDSWSTDLTFSQAETSTVTVDADTAGSLSEKYFLLSSRTTNYYVWYDVDNGSVDPKNAYHALTTKTGIEVDISANDSQATVATATKNAIDALTTVFDATESGSKDVNITAKVHGNTKDVSGGLLAGVGVWAFVNTQQGLTSEDYKLIFGAYDECSDVQKRRYSFISPNTNEFVSDGLKAYQIIL